MLLIVSPSIMKDTINKIMNPNNPVKAFVKLISKFLNCLEKTCAKAKDKAIKLAKNNPKKLSTSFGSKKIIIIPVKALKINTHFFVLIFSPNMTALARIPKGIANCEPKIIGDIIFE